MPVKCELGNTVRDKLEINLHLVSLKPPIMDASPHPPSNKSPPPPPAQKYIGSPTDFLKGVVGKRVIVRLTSGVDYQGQT
jgi:hypothetical protein